MAFAKDIGASHAAKAGADLSDKLYHLAKMNSSEEFVLSGAGEDVFGAITEGAVAGKPVSVQYGGIAKVKVGAAVVAGADVMSDASGRAITATVGNYVIGKCVLGAANANEIASVALVHAGKDTTA